MKDTEKQDPKLVGILVPGDNDPVDLSPNGVFSATIRVSADVQKVAAWVYPGGGSVPLPLEPPKDAVRMDATAQLFTFPNIPGSLGSVQEPHPQNRLVVWGWTGSEWSYRDDVQFRGTCQPSATVDVPATSCLWFAWASPASAIQGPEGETDTHRPQVLIVPQGSQSVALSVSDGIWWHVKADKRRSGADGLNGSGDLPDDKRNLENDAYCSADFKSEGIKPLKTHLNKLVGIWEIDGQAPTAESKADQRILGQNPGSLTVPTGATRLFLGFHDGRHWINNGGSVSVTADWSN